MGAKVNLHIGWVYVDARGYCIENWLRWHRWIYWSEYEELLASSAMKQTVSFLEMMVLNLSAAILLTAVHVQ